MKRQNQINNDPKTEQLIQAFVDEILRYNKAHNIVGRYSKGEIISLDIIDCETTLKHIQPSQTILDIGSGAGLPGLVIAIKKPLSKVTMFEKNKKKAYFIKKTIRTLGLKNAKIVDKAITPELITDTLFDVVTARALAPANKIVNMSQHLLTKTGKFLLMKGDIEKIKEEVAELDINTYSYTIHKTKTKDSKKHILEINKK